MCRVACAGLNLSHFTHTYWRGTQILNQYILGLFDLGMVQVRLGSKLLTRASSLAFDFKIYGYDALYVAVSEVVDGKWITADAKARLKIKSLDRSVLL